MFSSSPERFPLGGLRILSLAMLSSLSVAACGPDEGGAEGGSDTSWSSTSSLTAPSIPLPSCLSLAAAEAALRATGYPLKTLTVNTPTYHEWSTGFAAPSGSGFFSVSAGGCAHEVHGLIFDKWKQLGGVNGTLGGPLTDELPAGVGVAVGGRGNNFQRGSIFWSGATGAHSIIGAIRDRWNASNAAGLSPGLPTSDEKPACFGKDLTHDRIQNFEKETYVWRARDGWQFSDPNPARSCSPPLTNVAYQQYNHYDFSAFGGSAHSKDWNYLIANDSQASGETTWHIWRCPKSMADSCNLMASPGWSTHVGDPDFDQANGLLYMPFGEHGSPPGIAVYRDIGGSDVRPVRSYSFPGGLTEPAWVAKSPIDGLLYVGGRYESGEPDPTRPAILQVDVYREPAWTNTDGGQLYYPLTLVTRILLNPDGYASNLSWWQATWPQGGAFGPDGVLYLGVDHPEDKNSDKTGVLAFDMRPWYEHVYDHLLEAPSFFAVNTLSLVTGPPGAKNFINIPYEPRFTSAASWRKTEFEGVDVDGTTLWASLGQAGVLSGSAQFFAYHLQ